MSIERIYHSDVDAGRLLAGAVIEAESLYGGGRQRFEVERYTGTYPDGTVQLYIAGSLTVIKADYRVVSNLDATEPAPYRGGPKRGK